MVVTFAPTIVSMDAVTPLHNFYLIAVGATLGAVLASVSIALYVSRIRVLDWFYAQATRALMRDSLRSGKSQEEFRPRRSR